MKKIIFSLVLILATFTTFAQQNGGDVSNIKLKNSSGTKDDWWRFGHGAMVYDSVGNVYQAAIKLKTDSIYTKLNTGLTFSGIVKKTLATQVVSSDTGLVVNAVMHGLTTGGGGGYVDVKVNPSGALTVDATVDSTTQRSTLKISQLPSITIANTAFTANAGTNLNTSALALESGGNLSAVVSNTNSLRLSQGSPTSGQVGNLPLAATTTSAPTYTTGQSNPLSLNTDGELRVNYAAGATAAKQPALGTAGVPSADVISVQGVAGGRSIIVDGSAVTQPISVAAPTTIYNGKKTVTTAGARVQLASSQAVRSVCIKALQTNTGYIYVGDGSVTSTTGIQLLAGDTISLDISNLSTVTIDSSVSGEGVTYIATN